MKKLKLLLANIAAKLEETVNLQREAQRTGNPHLVTKYAGQAAAYIHVIAQINALLAPKEKKTL